MSKTWKSVEARIARFWGSERTPLSGGNSKITRSDSLHPLLFIEAKTRKKFAVAKLYRETEALAKKEGKIPIVCLQEKNQQGFLVVMKSTDIDRLLTEKEVLK